MIIKKYICAKENLNLLTLTTAAAEILSMGLQAFPFFIADSNVSSFILPPVSYMSGEVVEEVNRLLLLDLNWHHQ